MCDLTCKRCGFIGKPHIWWQVCRGGRPVHLRADCGACGAFVKYVQQTPDVLASVWDRLGPPSAAPPVGCGRDHPRGPRR
jgi:hypothetical protein